MHFWFKYVYKDIMHFWFKAGFRKGRGTGDQIANIHWIIEKARGFQENIYFCFIDYAKVFACVDHDKLGKILKEMWIPDHLTCLLRNLYEGQEATVRTGHGKRTGSKLGKEYVKAVYCHPAYLTYVQSTSCEMLGWMKHKLESRLPGEISITLDMQITPPLWQKSKRNWRASWWKWKRRVKSWLETQNSENKDHGIWSHHFMANRWENNGNSETLFSWAPKSLQMMTAAMKLKDAYSLEGKLWPT